MFWVADIGILSVESPEEVTEELKIIAEELKLTTEELKLTAEELKLTAEVLKLIAGEPSTQEDKFHIYTRKGETTSSK